MKLRRVQVSGFRGLDRATEVNAIGDGLTLVGGDNEAGKSTWLEAVRAALFDRHTLSGKPAEALQPLGQRIGPEITVEFECAGADWRLWKRFCQKPAAELSGPNGERHTGDAAEDRLQALLGFERPGRGRAGPPSQGVFGLLWLTQGEAHLHRQPEESARRALGKALESEVGDVLGGGSGQILLDHLAREKAEYWTPTGRPTGSLRSATEAAERLDREHQAALAGLAEYRDSVDRLARIDRDRAALDAADGIAALETRLGRARQAHAELDAARQRKAQSDSDLRLAEAEAVAAASRWQERRTLIAELERADARLGDGEDATRQQSERLTALETELLQTHSEDEAARQAQRSTEEHVAALEQRERVDRLSADELRLGRALKRALAARRDEQAARRAAAAITATREDLDALREMDEQLARVRERLSSGATRLWPELDTPYRISGHAREDADGIEVTGEAVLDLEALGRIRIRPGGEDLAATERQMNALATTREKALQRLGMPDTGAAQDALEERQRHENRAREAAGLIDAVAPEGLDGLQQEYERVKATLAALTADTPADDDSGKADDGLDAARESVRLAHERLLQAQRRRGDCEQRLAGLRESIAADRSRRETQRAERDRIAERLRVARDEYSDDALHRNALDAERQVSEVRGRQQASTAEIEALDPERTELRLQTAEAAYQGALEQHRDLRRQGDELRARLDALGQSGLSETAQALEADLADALRERDRIQRDADAVWHAWAALDAAARAARETYIGPLTARLQPYLTLLLPEARLDFDDELGAASLHRHGQSEPVARLSVGTREQLAIITRLAFADLLAEHGEPTPIILDDALVFADETRLEAMQLVLTRAAQHHQIIILTCRPSDYRGLGATLRRLEAPAATSDTGERE